MNNSFIKSWDNKQVDIRKMLSETPQSEYDSYEKLVKIILDNIINPDRVVGFDTERMHIIDDGEYSGMRVFLVPIDEYEPSCYFITRVWYGSCSGCDTLLSISGYSGEMPTDKQVNDYMTLILHLIQNADVIGESFWN